MKRIVTLLLAAATLLASTAAPALAGQRKARPMPLHQLISSYDRMSPQQVLQQLWLRTQDDYLQLSIYTGVGADIYLRACHADASIQFVLGGGVSNCQQLAYDRQMALQWTSPQSIQQHIDSERNTMLIAHKCSTGQLARSSCNAYTGTVSAYNQQMHDTSMQIIRNMGNQCRVGIDPGCHW